MWMNLTLLNCTLKMGRIVHFMSCVFDHQKNTVVHKLTLDNQNPLHWNYSPMLLAPVVTCGASQQLRVCSKAGRVPVWEKPYLTSTISRLECDITHLKFLTGSIDTTIAFIPVMFLRNKWVHICEKFEQWLVHYKWSICVNYCVICDMLHNLW